MPLDSASMTQEMPDKELQCRVKGHLAEKKRPSLSRLEVQVHQGMITLSGCVASFYEKQLAIHSCLSAAGCGRLVDAVKVAAYV